MNKFLTYPIIIFLFLSNNLLAYNLNDLKKDIDKADKQELGEVIYVICEIGERETLFLSLTELEIKQKCGCTAQQAINDASRDDIANFIKQMFYIIEMSADGLMNVDEDAMDYYFGDGTLNSFRDHFYFSADSTCRTEIWDKKYQIE